MKAQKTTLITVLSVLVLWSCNRSGDQDTNKLQYQIDSIESAIPHGAPLPGTSLSESEKSTLRSAKGKEAEVISTQQLKALIDQDSSGLILYNLWEPTCSNCGEMAKIISELQQKVIGPDKFKIVHLVPDIEDRSIINGIAREWNLADPVFCISYDTIPQTYSVIDNSWDGNHPAILLVNKEEGLRLFYQKTFTINELEALMLPFTF